MAMALDADNECAGCPGRTDQYFCNLEEATLSDLRQVSSTKRFPKRSVLFSEGNEAEGVYILCSGRVKLSAFSEEGRTLIVRIAEPGELIGLSTHLNGRVHKTTAVALSAVTAKLVRNGAFIGLLERRHDAALNALKQLSANYHRAHRQICSLGLSGSVSEKLARLLLEWLDKLGSSEPSVQFTVQHTHEEIGEMIGASRETVTRLLKEFREMGIVQISRSIMTVVDAGRLRAIARQKP
jgi:CRP/FNR family transcriptional regulator, cyclic AMP receptor protein